jgi:hypothetical protein
VGTTALDAPFCPGRSSSANSYLTARFDAEHSEFGVFFRGGGDCTVC